MSTLTPNLGLTKPSGTDYVAVGVLNENMDIVDSAVGNLGQLQTANKTNLVSAINEARTAGQYPPYIGPNGNWYQWNSSMAQYEDSGTKAQGPQGEQGEQGEQGIQGPTGPQGETGATGATGPQGDPGVAATITVGGTTTGEPGTDAEVVNIGSTNAAVLEFTMPRGEHGIQGPKGDIGPIGPQGIEGPQGPKGDTGTGLDIKGTYDTLGALQAAITQPAQGDMYNVGTADPYTV